MLNVLAEQSEQALSKAMEPGGIILCGGQGSRMGLPKATLPFGPELMLQRVYRLLSEVVGPIVVVAAEDQTLPELPVEAIVARDEWPNRGPLEGLCAGMKAMRARCELVYVTSCDVPLLQPGFVRQLLQLSPGYEAVVPRDDQFAHPLSAVYRTEILEAIEDMLSQDNLRPRRLLERINTRYVPVVELRKSDPQLKSLRNLNHPPDYFRALLDAGFAVDPAIQAALRTG